MMQKLTGVISTAVMVNIGKICIMSDILKRSLPMHISIVYREAVSIFFSANQIFLYKYTDYLNILVIYSCLIQLGGVVSSVAKF